MPSEGGAPSDCWAGLTTLGTPYCPVHQFLHVRPICGAFFLPSRLLLGSLHLLLRLDEWCSDSPPPPRQGHTASCSNPPPTSSSSGGVRPRSPAPPPGVGGAPGGCVSREARGIRPDLESAHRWILFLKIVWLVKKT